MVRRPMLALLTVGLAHASPALAGEEGAPAEPVQHVSLRWDAPPACPDDAQVVGAVVALLGQPLAETREQQLAVSINVQEGAGGFSAKLAFTSPQGTQERFLEHPDCSKLMEGAALLAALAIDPERVQARRAAVEAEAVAPAEKAAALPVEPTPEPATASCPPVPPARVPPPMQPTRRVSLGVSAFVGAAGLPGIRPGLAAELGARFDHFQVRVLARHWASGSSDIQSGPLSVELSLATVGAHGCFVPRRDDWSLLGCLGLTLGDLSGSGQGLNHAHTRHALFGAAEAGLVASYSRVQPAPFAGLSLSWGLVRPAFGASLEGVETETYRPSAFGLLGSVGLSFGL